MAASKLVNIIELSAMLGVHKNTVFEWIKAGMPVAVKAGRGEKGGHQFLMSDVLDWHKGRAVIQATGSNDAMSAEEAKRRKLMAEAGLQEIELAKKQSLVVELADIERDLSNRFAQMRSNLLKIPERTAIRLIGETEETRIKQIIREELIQAMETISDWQYEEDADESEVSES